MQSCCVSLLHFVFLDVLITTLAQEFNTTIYKKPNLNSEIIPSKSQTPFKYKTVAINMFSDHGYILMRISLMRNLKQ